MGTRAAAGSDEERSRRGRVEGGAGLVEGRTRVAAGANDQRLRGPLGRRVLGVRGWRRASKRGRLLRLLWWHAQLSRRIRLSALQPSTKKELRRGEM